MNANNCVKHISVQQLFIIVNKYSNFMLHNCDEKFAN